MKIDVRTRIAVKLALIAALVAGLAASRSSAQSPATDQSGDIVVTVTVKKVKQGLDELQKKLDQARQEEKAAEKSLQNADAESRPRLQQTFKAAQNYEQLLLPTIARIHDIVAQVEAPGQNADKARELLHEANSLSSVAFLTADSRHIHTEFLDDLKARVEIGNRIPVNGAAIEPIGGGAASVFSEGEMGGGVFLDEPASLPANPHAVAYAEYDLNLNRFALHLNGGERILFPPTDPSRTATVTRCLFNPPPRNRVCVSEGIDPVKKGDLSSTAPLFHDQVLFGCQDLWDSDAGRILIDSDDLLSHLAFQGKNREGDNLMQRFDYHSLTQITLDHPINQPIAPDAPADDKLLAMRIWIRPSSISARQVGSELIFDDIPFQVFTSTVKLPGPRDFHGTAYPNPGADIFSAIFDRNFESFAHMVLRRDEETGEEIHPFEDLRQLALIVGIVSWIKDSSISMDTSWAAQYPVARAITRRNLPQASRNTVESEIVPPIVIYNQFGPSRIIDKNGDVFRYEYDSGGRFIRMVRITKDRYGHTVEVTETHAPEAAQGENRQ